MPAPHGYNAALGHIRAAIFFDSFQSRRASVAVNLETRRVPPRWLQHVPGAIRDHRRLPWLDPSPFGLGWFWAQSRYRDSSVRSWLFLLPGVPSLQFILGWWTR